MKPLSRYITEASYKPEDYKNAADAVKANIEALEDLVYSRIGIKVKLTVEAHPRMIYIFSDDILPQCNDRIIPALFNSLKVTASGNFDRNGLVAFDLMIWMDWNERPSTSNEHILERIYFDTQINEWVSK